MEHLIAVLWEDHWKPWIMDKLSLLGHILLGVAVLTGIVVGMIWVTIASERVLNGLI